MVDQLQTVRRQGGLTFKLTQNRIIVKTSLQTFFLEPKACYWKKRFNMVWLMIELGEIRDLSELASWCCDANGRQVIEWKATLVRYGESDEN